MDISSINEDYKYEKVSWPVERIFWLLMGVFLILGLLGFLGDNGVFNNQTVNAENYQIEYQKYLRVEKSSEIRIILKESTEDCIVKIDKDYFKKIKVNNIVPEPLETGTAENEINYRFKAGNNGTITFHIDPILNGSQDLQLTINEQKETLKQYIYF